MSRSNTQWVIAFNASCGTCRAISESIAQACDGKLEVLPLANEQVEQWRKQALGQQAPLQPTLLRINEQGSAVQAWTGPTMGFWLMRRLGLQSTLRVLAALEQVRHGEAASPSKQLGQGVIGRAQFLRLCAGGAVAAGMILMGKMPVKAASDDAKAWVEANKNNLPTSYDGLIAYPLAYRKAIYRASPPAVQAQFWQEQFTRYRAAHPQCTAEQTTVLDRALELTRTDLTMLTDADEQAMIAAFGKDEARTLFATLGSEPPITSALSVDYSCECSNSSDYCGGGKSCQLYADGCSQTSGCGTLYLDPCNGMCG